VGLLLGAYPQVLVLVLMFGRKSLHCLLWGQRFVDYWHLKLGNTGSGINQKVWFLGPIYLHRVLVAVDGFVGSERRDKAKLRDALVGIFNAELLIGGCIQRNRLLRDVVLR
jgi:hypothetical protein